MRERPSVRHASRSTPSDLQMDQLVQHEKTTHHPRYDPHGLGTGPPKSFIDPVRQTGRCLPGWCSDIRHNINIVDVPQGATRVVQTKLHTDFGGLRDTVIGGFAIALKDIQVTPGTACVLPYEQWPETVRRSDYTMFHIPVPPSGNVPDAITNNTFIAVDTNGVVVPDQQNPDGTWKTIPNNPVLTNTDPQAPPPVTVSASPVGAHYFQDGVRTTLQGAVENSDGSIGCLVRSANNTFAYGSLTFGCVEIIPFQKH